jgi:hypothetical protein
MQPLGARKEMYIVEPWRYGWQRFGEHMDNTFLDPFIEGAWMTKHNGKYYLQYACPGTEFSGYADGVMYCNTAFGDYPAYLPEVQTDHLKGSFTGWMLLNYSKPVTVSSTLGGYNANYAVDEDIKTYWSAQTADANEWIVTDLGNTSTVCAIQVNYADQDAEFLGRSAGVYHQYMIYESLNGKKWNLLVDKSKNLTDVPHDYVELTRPVQTRYLKLVNIHMPTGKFAISGFRVFGHGKGDRPRPVKELIVLRTKKDRRSAWLRWSPSDDAYAYNIYMGTEPDKLYNCIMVYGVNEYWLKTMDNEKTYYFTIEALNENGVSTSLPVIKSE